MAHSLTRRRLKRTRLLLPSSSCTERTPVEVEDGRRSGVKHSPISKRSCRTHQIQRRLLREQTTATALWHTRCSGRRRACSRRGGGRSATRRSSGNSSGLYALQEAFLAFLCQFSFEPEHFFRQNGDAIPLGLPLVRPRERHLIINFLRSHFPLVISSVGKQQKILKIESIIAANSFP